MAAHLTFALIFYRQVAQSGYILKYHTKCSHTVKELNGLDLSVKNESKSKMCGHFPLYNCRNPFIKKGYL